jgi:16S rRNA (uracil1498-N3)-methyltransferase
MSHERRIFALTTLEPGSHYVPGESDQRHLSKALRLTLGDLVTVVDKTGIEFLSSVVNASPITLLLQSVLSSPSSAALSPVQAILVGLPKGPASDAIVEGATELGTPRIIFWEADHSVPKLAEGTKRLERWNKIAESAAKQSAQRAVPRITAIASLPAALQYIDDLNIQADRLVCTLTGDARPLQAYTASTSILAFGPEGDFSSSELEVLRNASFLPTTLGPYRLRSEMAVIAGISGIWALRLTAPSF